jgi:hypothetical protein
VTVAGVYRELYRHCSEPLGHMAPVDRADDYFITSNSRGQSKEDEMGGECGAHGGGEGCIHFGWEA